MITEKIIIEFLSCLHFYRLFQQKKKNKLIFLRNLQQQKFMKYKYGLLSYSFVAHI